MRQEPLKVTRLDQALPIDYINRAQKMREIAESPLRRTIHEHELALWWICFGILVTGILLVLWGGK